MDGRGFQHTPAKNILLLSAGHWKSSVLINFYHQQPGNLGDLPHTRVSWDCIRKECFHRVHMWVQPMETHTRTHTSGTTGAFWGALVSSQLPDAKLPASMKSDPCSINSLILQSSPRFLKASHLSKPGSVMWAEVTMRFMAGHKHWEAKPIWRIVLSTCGDLGRGLFKDPPVPLNCCELRTDHNSWKL